MYPCLWVYKCCWEYDLTSCSLAITVNHKGNIKLVKLGLKIVLIVQRRKFHEDLSILDEIWWKWTSLELCWCRLKPRNPVASFSKIRHMVQSYVHKCTFNSWAHSVRRWNLGKWTRRLSANQCAKFQNIFTTCLCGRSLIRNAGRKKKNYSPVPTCLNKPHRWENAPFFKWTKWCISDIWSNNFLRDGMNKNEHEHFTTFSIMTQGWTKNRIFDALSTIYIINF